MSLLFGEVEGSFFFGGVEDCKAVNRYTGMRLWGTSVQARKNIRLF